MDLNDLNLFARVAKAASFSAVADETGIPKQTVSRRIRLLEESLGCELFHRTTRRVSLTEAGERVVPLAEEAEGIVEEIKRIRDRTIALPSGLLRLNCDPLFGESFLAPLLNRFLSTYPEMRIETQLSTRRISLLDEGFDLAFRIGPLVDSSERVRPLGPARVRYVASSDYLARHGTPQKPSELNKHECLVLHYEGTGSQRWLFRKNRRDEWQSVQGRYRSNSFRCLYDAALDGHGIVASPAFYCEADVADGRLRTVLDTWLPDFGSINLVYPSQRQMSTKLRAFIDFAVDWFTRNPIP